MTSANSGSNLETLERELLGAIAGAADLAALEQVRITVLGKKGRIAELMQTLGALPPEQRKGFGQSVNDVKARVGEALEERKGTLEGDVLSQRLASERADVTLPVRLGPLADGRIHPVSQVYDECVEIFADMGFAVAEGPDIETDDLNFTKLNIPPEHPARQEHDTFYMRTPPGSNERAAGTAHAHEPRADPHHDEPEAAHPYHRAGPRLPSGQRCRRTRRCSIRSRASSSTRRPTWGT